MQSVIISDSSCLILLDKIGELALLKDLYGEVIVTPEVVLEVNLPNIPWLVIRKASDKALQNLIAERFGLGEASSIALAAEMETPLLIIDDNKAKRFAQRFGIRVTGTFGVLLAAKELGLIPLVKPYLEKIAKTNFRFDEDLKQLILKIANE